MLSVDQELQTIGAAQPTFWREEREATSCPVKLAIVPTPAAESYVLQQLSPDCSNPTYESIYPGTLDESKEQVAYCLKLIQY